MQAQQERKHAMEQIKLQMSEALLSSMLGGFTARRTLCTSEPGEKGAPEAVAESRVLKEQKITLSPEQELAVQCIKDGKNVFLTGCAGTGKSATVSAIFEQLHLKYGKDFRNRVAVTAMTGIAATLVSGVTIHSLLGLGVLSTHASFKNMHRNAPNRKKIKTVNEVVNDLDVLFIDEASMLSAELLQMLDLHLTQARKARHGDDKPFGGVQMVLSGDFYQLPPIANKSAVEDSKFVAKSGGYKPSATGNIKNRDSEPFYNRGFAFEAPVFRYGKFEVMELTKVFRQDDEGMVALLNDIRCGTPMEAHAAQQELERNCRRPLSTVDGIEPTCLFGTNRQVDELNALDEIEADLEVFEKYDTAFVTYEPPKTIYEVLVQEKALSRKKLDEMVGYLEAEMVNFTRTKGDALHRQREIEVLGLVEEKFGKAAKPFLEARDEWREEAYRELMRLGNNASGLFKQCLAADDVTLKEKAQVMLLYNLDVKERLVNGSRGVVVGWLDVDVDAPGSPGTTWAESVFDQAGSLESYYEVRRWFRVNKRVPIVRFSIGKGSGTLEIPVPPVLFSAYLPGLGLCLRAQMPLKLAWAVTVHKSQGMSLDMLVVNINNFWDHGQLYTALSRARTVEGLQMIGVNAKARKVHPMVEQQRQAWRDGTPMEYRPLPIEPHETEKVKTVLPWVWDAHRDDHAHASNKAAKEFFAQMPLLRA